MYITIYTYTNMYSKASNEPQKHVFGVKIGAHFTVPSLRLVVRGAAIAFFSQEILISYQKDVSE